LNIKPNLDRIVVGYCRVIWDNQWYWFWDEL
jgi:hypothetical protein